MLCRIWRRYVYSHLETRRHLVAALNAGGIETVACCCGHGKNHGNILLADGRVLNIYPTRKAWETAEKILSEAKRATGRERGPRIKPRKKTTARRTHDAPTTD